MPIVLLPTPRRIRRTRENFMLGNPAALSVSPGAAPAVVEALRQELEELFPGLETADSERSETAALRFTRCEAEGGLLEEAPPNKDEAFSAPFIMLSASRSLNFPNGSAAIC